MNLKTVGYPWPEIGNKLIAHCIASEFMLQIPTLLDQLEKEWIATFKDNLTEQPIQYNLDS